MSQAATEIFFRHVLLDPFSFPQTKTLYLQEGKEWDLDQEALVIDPNEGEDPYSPLGQRVAREKWQYILEIEAIRSVMDYLSDEVPKADIGTRLKAFIYYFEHDAFASAEDLA